jgi:hypothetical protein
LLVKRWLNEPPADDFNEFLEQLAHAAWLEERETDLLAAAIGKAFGGK